MNKKIISMFSVIIIILLLAGCKNSDYNKAKGYIDNGQYDEAIVILNKIPDYKDSKKIIENEKNY